MRSLIWRPALRGGALVVSLLLLVPSIAPLAPAAAPHLTKAAPRSSGTDLSAMAGDAYAYDPADHGELVFGNLGNPGANQTWFHNPDAWINQTGASGPPARFFATMAYDPAVGAVILFGGESAGTGGGLLNDTWEFRHLTWTQLAPRGAPPTTYETLDREMVYDPDLGALVLVLASVNVSGHAGSTNLSTWSFSNNTWTKIGFQGVNASVAPGFGNVLSWDSTDHSLVLPDAFNFSTFHDEVLSYQAGRWSPSSNGAMPLNSTVWAAASDPGPGSLYVQPGVIALGSFWFDANTLGFAWPTFSGGSSGWTNITSSAGLPVGLVVPFGATWDSNDSAVLVLGETLSSTPATGPSTWRFAQGKWYGPSTPGFIRHANPGGLVTSLPWLEIGIVVVAAAVAAAAVTLMLRRRRRAPPALASVLYPGAPPPPPPPSPPG